MARAQSPASYRRESGCLALGAGCPCASAYDRRKQTASAEPRGKGETSCVRTCRCLSDKKQEGCKSENNLHKLEGQRGKIQHAVTRKQITEDTRKAAFPSPLFSLALFSLSSPQPLPMQGQPYSALHCQASITSPDCTQPPQRQAYPSPHL